MQVPDLSPQSAAPLIRVGTVTTSRYCWAGCAFCRLALPLPKVPAAMAPAGLSVIGLKTAAVDWSGADEVRVRGGLSLAEPFDYWLHIIRAIRAKVSGLLVVFSPVEIWQFHIMERRPLRDLLRLLIWAGADALGPGGSESWDAEQRKRWTPYRVTVEEWLMVARSATQVDLPVIAAPIVTPQDVDTDWAEYVAVLSDIPIFRVEVKPLVSDNTRLSVLGSAGPLETGLAVAAIREAIPGVRLVVDWNAHDAEDAQQLFGSFGADGLAVPMWEVVP